MRWSRRFTSIASNQSLIETDSQKQEGQQAVSASETTATREMAGRTCPYCRFPLDEGGGITECPSCHAIHHRDCWEENGGCAVALCPGGPSQVTASQPQVPLPPTPAPTSARQPPPPP